ncbi:MAG: 16S rRNA (guanine(966)-N(2))-methyltransferase RsmD [Deltaproteobacteria bacterium]|nr:16S rRNA (guanine(966)-N(2))-methyltransferase RsmD [Deltaproteobacteria bacterium]
MRIISGSLRGRRLHAPPEGVVRPTPDRVRESVFNILGQKLDDLEFLDLYAGSGAVGLEAVSRGVRRTVLVESDPAACEVIRRNIARLGCEERSELVCRSVDQALGAMQRSGDGFDVVFVDPPYSDPPGQLAALLARLGETSLVHPDGCVVLQQKRGRPVATHPCFSARKPRNYGITSILVFDRLSTREPPA